MNRKLKKGLFVLLGVSILQAGLWMSHLSFTSSAHATSKSPSITTTTAKQALPDPELQPLSVYEAHHEKARQASGRSIGRLLLGLMGVLALFGAFALLGLPRLVARYPRFFEYWQRHSTANRTDKESNQKADSVSTAQAELPETVSFPAHNNGTAAMRLVNSTLLNTSQELHLVEVGDRQLIIVSTADGVSILCDLTKPPKDSMANRTHTVDDLFPSKGIATSTKPVNITRKPLRETASVPSSVSADLRNTLKTIVPPPEKKASGWVLEAKDLKDTGKTKPYARPPKTKSFSKLIAKVPQKDISSQSEMSIELLGDYDDIL